MLPKRRPETAQVESDPETTEQREEKEMSVSNPESLRPGLTWRLLLTFSTQVEKRLLNREAMKPLQDVTRDGWERPLRAGAEGTHSR